MYRRREAGEEKMSIMITRHHSNFLAARKCRHSHVQHGCFSFLIPDDRLEVAISRTSQVFSRNVSDRFRSMFVFLVWLVMGPWPQTRYAVWHRVIKATLIAIKCHPGRELFFIINDPRVFCLFYIGSHCEIKARLQLGRWLAATKPDHQETSREITCLIPDQEC